MDEFLAELLGVLLEFLLELIFEALASSGARAVRRGSKRLSSEQFKPAEWNRPPLIAISTVLGAAAGIVSIVILPAPIFHSGKIHGLSLLLSPLLTGFVMAGVGALLRRRNRKTVPWESFWGGFAFALGMAAIRFVATR
jgi:hypothetical protein